MASLTPISLLREQEPNSFRIASLKFQSVKSYLPGKAVGTGVGSGTYRLSLLGHDAGVGVGNDVSAMNGAGVGDPVE